MGRQLKILIKSRDEESCNKETIKEAVVNAEIVKTGFSTDDDFDGEKKLQVIVVIEITEEVTPEQIAFLTNLRYQENVIEEFSYSDVRSSRQVM